MKCPVCDSKDTVVAVVHLIFKIPLLKGGGIKPPAITTAQVKGLWDGAAEENKPVECTHCGARLRYFSGTGLKAVEGP